MKEDIEVLLQNFIDAAVLHGKASKEGDYKTANKQFRLLAKMYKSFEQDQILAETILGRLFQHTDVSVRTWAAVDALNLGIYVKQARDILQQISEDQALGILRLNAEMALKELEKRGKLRI